MNAKTNTKTQFKELEGDTLTPISIFQRLKGTKKFLLESSLKHEKSGRYSFIGSDPYMEIKSHSTSKTTINFHTKSKKVTTNNKNLINIIQEHIHPTTEKLPFPFYGGAVGYMGYDIIRQFEDIGHTPEDDIQMPDAHLMFYEKVIVMDYQLQKVYVVLTYQEEIKAQKEVQEQLIQIEQQLTTPSEHEFISNKIETVTFKSNMNKQQFLKKVEQAKEHIRKGDIFQIVLSQRLQAEFQGDPFTFYRQLRKSNPSPYMFYVDFNDYLVLGASPESLIQVQGEQVLTNPIAGTRKRGQTPEEDRRLESELLLDEKELAEHRMLVDLARNDLGRVSEFGTVELTKYLTIERFKHVMHIVSEVKGKLRKDQTSLHVLSACLPAGTVSGAPKIRAMQLINQFEPTKRGVYSGAVGYINVNGDLDFALAIRTMVIKENQAFVQAGAGIVLDSIPESEYEETLNKAKGLLEVNI